MNLNIIRHLFYRYTLRGLLVCIKCNNHMKKQDDLSLWHHGFSCSEKNIWLLRSLNSDDIDMGVTVGCFQYHGKSVLDVIFDCIRTANKYPQVPFLRWETGIQRFLTLLAKNDIGGDKQWNGAYYYYLLGEDSYPLMDHMMKNQAYKCSFPDCTGEYDCLPTMEIIARHYEQCHFAQK